MTLERSDLVSVPCKSPDAHTPRSRCSSSAVDCLYLTCLYAPRAKVKVRWLVLWVVLEQFVDDFLDHNQDHTNEDVRRPVGHRVNAAQRDQTPRASRRRQRGERGGGESYRGEDGTAAQQRSDGPKERHWLSPWWLAVSRLACVAAFPAPRAILPPRPILASVRPGLNHRAVGVPRGLARVLHASYLLSRSTGSTSASTKPTTAYASRQAR